MPADYRPPRRILDVLRNIEFEQALPRDDPRYVDTREARGSQKTLQRLALKLGLDLRSQQLLPPVASHVLFFGHVGSGKTTELRHYAAQLDGPGRFFVIEVDVLSALDPHNLQYTETLMAMAEALLNSLQARGIELPSAAYRDMEQWFAERVLTHEKASEFAAQMTAGADARTGLPWLMRLFAGFTASIKTNSSYRDSLREVVRNSFGTLRSAFNTLIDEAKTQLGKHDQLGHHPLFIVDGTDKLREDDTRRFFVDDAEQIVAIGALAVYTAPLSLKFSGALTGKLDSNLVLPMIRLEDSDGTPCAAGKRAMEDILLRRADRALFASQTEIDSLVSMSGGHPRELLRLLKLCCELAESESIDAETVTQAVAKLAADYRYGLETEDYSLLVQIDADPAGPHNSKSVQRLLHRLALMQYNDGSWMRSHPVVRTLSAYRSEHARRMHGQAP